MDGGAGGKPACGERTPGLVDGVFLDGFGEALVRQLEGYGDLGAPRGRLAGGGRRSRGNSGSRCSLGWGLRGRRRF